MMSELKDRVEDWKGLDFALFGKLLLFDVLTVRKRNGNSKEGGSTLISSSVSCCVAAPPTPPRANLNYGLDHPKYQVLMLLDTLQDYS